MAIPDRREAVTQHFLGHFVRYSNLPNRQCLGALFVTTFRSDQFLLSEDEVECCPPE